MVFRGTYAAGDGSAGTFEFVPTSTATQPGQSFKGTYTAANGKKGTFAFAEAVAPPVVTGGPVFGGNLGSAWGPACWQTVHDAVHHPGALYAYRDYAKPGLMPVSWNDGFSVPADATATVLSWKPPIAGVLAGTFDAQITQWAKSCQARELQAPGTQFVSTWHEADSLSPGKAGNPVSADVLALHAHIYPRFKTFAPDVPYGQIFSRDSLVKSPAQWVSCPDTAKGGSLLDFYAIDGYDHGRTAAEVFNPGFAAIRSVAPKAKLGITELNCADKALRPKWFEDAWAIASGTQYPCVLFLPFFMGMNNSQVICWLDSDTATAAALRKIAAASAA